MLLVVFVIGRNVHLGLLFLVESHRFLDSFSVLLLHETISLRLSNLFLNRLFQCPGTYQRILAKVNRDLLEPPMLLRALLLDHILELIKQVLMDLLLINEFLHIKLLRIHQIKLIQRPLKYRHQIIL